jgi:hypothetical protein
MIPRALFQEYVVLLHRHGILHQVVRLADEDADLFGEQWLAATDDDLAGSLDELTLETLHPDWIAIRRARVRIEKGVDAAGHTAPERVLVALFPTDSFNAQSRISDRGLLILVDKGLVRLLRGMARVALESFAVGPEPPRLPLEASAVAVADLIDSYLFDESSASEAPLTGDLGQLDLFAREVGLRRDRDRRAFLAEALGEACLQFAIAHEYAHFAAGHLHAGRQHGRDLRVGRLDLISKRNEEELEADVIGAVIHGHGSSFDGEAPERLDDQIALAIAGPVVFLGIDDFLGRVVDQLGRPFRRRLVRDHPPSAERRDRVRARAERQLTQEGAPHSLLDLADAVAYLWLSSIEPRVTEVLAARNERVEPGSWSSKD